MSTQRTKCWFPSQFEYPEATARYDSTRWSLTSKSNANYPIARDFGIALNGLYIDWLRDFFLELLESAHLPQGWQLQERHLSQCTVTYQHTMNAYDAAATRQGLQLCARKDRSLGKNLSTRPTQSWVSHFILFFWEWRISLATIQQTWWLRLKGRSICCYWNR